MDNSSINDQDEICRSKSANYCISMFEKIRHLQQRKKFCDITVNVRGENYFAHSVVLAAASQHFADVLDGEETQPVVVDFNDMSSAVFEKLLEYIYSGNSNLITSKNAEDLFEASKILRIGTLEAACSEALVITASNWYKIKVIAGEHHRSEEVYEKCQAYALQHFTEIAATDAYLELPLEQVKEFVADSRVVISSEEEMFSAVLKWVKHDLENRKQQLFEVMKNVKFPLMDKTFFLNTAMKEPLLKADLDCLNLLLEASAFHAGIQPSEPSPRTVPRQHFKKQLVSYIFATGGMHGSSYQSECEVYNPRTSKWHPIAPMLTPRDSHALVGVGQLLYVFGGNNGQNYLSSVEYYDATKDAWAWTTPMQHARWGPGICALNGSIFIGGGKNKYDVYLSTVEQFDPSAALYKTCAAMNTDRCHFKMAVTDDCIYAIGGWNPDILDSVERFDPREGRWSASPSMSRKRSSPGVTVLNGYIYCTGGYGGDEENGERFDIRKNTWEPIPNMISKRYGHELVALDGCVYAIGGSNLNSVEKFDPDTNRWVEIQSMLHTRGWLGATALDCVEINHH